MCMTLREFYICANLQILHIWREGTLSFTLKYKWNHPPIRILCQFLWTYTSRFILHRVYENLVELCIKFYTVLGVYWTKLASCVLWTVNGASKKQTEILVNNSVMWSAAHKLWKLSTKSDLHFKSYSFLTCVKSLVEIFSHFYNVVHNSVSHLQAICNTAIELQCTVPIVNSL